MENYERSSMNERKKKILWAIVQDYISSAEPVGSRTIAKKYDMGISSATIRNEMQDLEDEGYLEQPHTSAGRIPSVKGYRFYVDCLMEPVPVTGEEEDLLRHTLTEHATRMDEVFRNMAKVIASLTHTLSVAAQTGKAKRRFNYMQFLPLDGQRAILLAVTDEGRVTHTIVPVPLHSSLEELQHLAEKISHFLHDREIDGIDEKMILSFQKDTEENLSDFHPVFYALNEIFLPRKKVYSGGAAGLIKQPEFQDVQKVQEILNLLEEKQILEGVLSSDMDRPIAVEIGTENLVKPLSELSVIRARFTAEGRVIGSVAVLGPTRMEYDKIIGLLHFMQKQIGALLKS